MNAAAWVGLAGILSTTIVSVLAQLIAARESKARRAHERELAHDARAWEHRREAYSHLIREARADLVDAQRWVTELDEGEGAAVGLTYEQRPDWVVVQSDSALYGSQVVLDKSQAFIDAIVRLAKKCQAARARADGNRREDDDYEDSDLEVKVLWDDFFAARDRMRELQATAREELMQLPAAAT